MSAVSLLRVGYEKKLRDEHDRRVHAEQQWRRAEEERSQLIRERSALRRILGSSVGEGREGEERRRRQKGYRSMSVDRKRGRRSEGREGEEREELHSHGRALAAVEGELRRREERMEEMEERERERSIRERELEERLGEALELVNDGMEKERILRGELEYAQSRQACHAAGAAGGGQLQLPFNVAANEGALQRLHELSQLLEETREKMEGQERLLGEMRVEMRVLMDERDAAKDRVAKLERKYGRAKGEMERMRGVVEHLTDSADPSGRLVDGRSDLDRARELHATVQQGAAAAAAADREEQRQSNETADLSPIWELVENERMMARSLHEDLDAVRKMLIDRDCEVNELTAELSACRISLSAAETHLEMERARADEGEVAAAAVAAAAADNTAYATALDESILENEGLNKRLSEALKQCASYKAKLEAQGRDLIAVKRELQRLQLK